MRDAMGSGWIFSICLTFIVLFTAYLAISVNYARAFRVKNHILSDIEEHEGYDEGLRQEIEEYLVNEGYTATGICEPYISVAGEETDWALEECLGDNAIAGQCSICLYRKPADNQKNPEVGAERAYYRVIAFFRFDLPIVSTFLPSFQVGGDSRYIYDFANNGKY